MTTVTTPALPPRWVIRAIWKAHRLAYRVSGGRWGLRPPIPGDRVGMLALHTIGRVSGVERTVILCYLDDGPNLVLLAMNGWDAAEPAWWRNLQARPETQVDLPGGRRDVRARVAVGSERERLWTLVRGHSGYGELDAMAALRGERETAVVVLEAS